jgi:arylsulfatase A-like enzyme
MIWIKYFILLFAASTLAACSPSNQKRDAEAEPPNILLILVDDMGYGDVRISGNPYIETPFLDELANQSVRFQRFYVSPVCAPTRASLLTGRYHQRTGVRSVTNGYETMAPDEITLAEILQDNGYRTALFGKWHLGEYYPSLPNAQGFDEFLGFRTGHAADYYDALLEYNGHSQATEGYITNVLTNEAIRFMEKTAGEPFFCYLSYNAPHTPLQIDSSWFVRYLDKGLDERAARVYGMVENIDSNISRITTFLEESGRSGNTIVIFLSDNGPINGWRVPQEAMRYNAGLRDQKFTIYEGGIRTQCYWRWPGQWPAREITQTFGAHIDVLPTLLEILDLPLPEGRTIDGQSLVPLLTNTSSGWTRRTFFQNFALATLREPAPFPGGIAIHPQGWKMVNGDALYYLPDDPGERENRAAQHPALLDSLQQAYLSWWETVHRQRGFQPRPLPVGYDQENPAYLQPHHGKAEGQLQFMGWKGLLGDQIRSHPTGVDGDWITNWQHPGDQITWEVEIVEGGTYRIGIQAQQEGGATAYPILLKAGEQEVHTQTTVTSSSDDWTYISLTDLELPAGLISLRLELTDAAADNVLKVAALVVEKIEGDL